MDSRNLPTREQVRRFRKPLYPVDPDLPIRADERLAGSFSGVRSVCYLFMEPKIIRYP